MTTSDASATGASSVAGIEVCMSAPHIDLLALNGRLAVIGMQGGTKGELNLAKLLAKRGWVTAASEWDEPPQRKRVREGLLSSWEDLLHETGTEQ